MRRCAARAFAIAGRVASVRCVVFNEDLDMVQLLADAERASLPTPAEPTHAPVEEAKEELPERDFTPHNSRHLAMWYEKHMGPRPSYVLVRPRVAATRDLPVSLVQGLFAGHSVFKLTANVTGYYALFADPAAARACFVDIARPRSRSARQFRYFLTLAGERYTLEDVLREDHDKLIKTAARTTTECVRERLRVETSQHLRAFTRDIVLEQLRRKALPMPETVEPDPTREPGRPALSFVRKRLGSESLKFVKPPKRADSCADTVDSGHMDLDTTDDEATNIKRHKYKLEEQDYPPPERLFSTATGALSANGVLVSKHKQENASSQLTPDTGTPVSATPEHAVSPMSERLQVPTPESLEFEHEPRDRTVRRPQRLAPLDERDMPPLQTFDKQYARFAPYSATRSYRAVVAPLQPRQFNRAFASVNYADPYLQVETRTQRKRGVFRPRVARAQHLPHRTIVGRSSIHAWGLFAGEDIPEKKLVVEYVGSRIRAGLADVRELQYKLAGVRSTYFFRVGKDAVIDATARGNAARFMNHSCDPNCDSAMLKVDDIERVGLFTTRPIAKNEELTFNYRFTPAGANAQRLKCNCGAPNCTTYLT